MRMRRTTTYSAKANEVEPNWHVIDADGVPMGRLASQVATMLQGKHRPTYTPHVLTGDFVIIVNAEKVGVTGRKASTKVYYRYSGYPGGLRETSFRETITKHPERVIRHAVRGMLPKNSLGRRMLKRMKVYAGPDHPHEAQVTGSLKRQEKASNRPEE